MAKSFANRFLLMGLFSLLVFGNISSAMAAFCGLTVYPTACAAGNLVCLSERASLWACKMSTSLADDGRCLYKSTYNVYSGTSGTSIGYFTACETVSNSSRGASCVSGATGYPVTLTFDGSTFDAYGCCGTGTSSTTVTIPNLNTPRGTRTTTTTGRMFTSVKYKRTDDRFEMTANTSASNCPSNGSSTYVCSCNTGFKEQNQGTSSCNCDAYAPGYSCYVASCTADSGNATQRYISDDRKSCELCPTGSEDDIDPENQVMSMLGGASGAGYTDFNVTQSSKVGKTSCYKFGGTHPMSGTWKDGNGNTFSFSQSCYYTE